MLQSRENSLEPKWSHHFFSEVGQGEGGRDLTVEQLEVRIFQRVLHCHGIDSTLLTPLKKSTTVLSTPIYPNILFFILLGFRAVESNQPHYWLLHFDALRNWCEGGDAAEKLGVEMVLILLYMVVT